MAWSPSATASCRGRARRCLLRVIRAVPRSCRLHPECHRPGRPPAVPLLVGMHWCLKLMDCLCAVETRTGCRDAKRRRSYAFDHFGECAHEVYRWRGTRSLTAARNRSAPRDAGEGQFSRAAAANVTAVKQQRRRPAMEFFSGLDVSIADGDLRGRRQGRGADADRGADRGRDRGGPQAVPATAAACRS